MAKQYKCDYCEQVHTSKPEVYVKGITGTCGGILLTDRLTEKHFCNPECFWDWIEKYTPTNMV